MKVIIHFGIRRSGNHGILNLIKNSGIKKCVHINDLHNFKYELFQQYSKINITLFEIDNTWTGFKDVDLLIISLENKIIPKKELEKFYSIPNIHFVILLRNPFNNAASAYKYLITTECKSTTILLKYLMTLWKNYTDFFLKDENLKSTLILYDKFYKNEKYRTNIFEKLGLTYNKKHLNEIKGWGKSFFDLKATNTNNQKIFERWKVFENDEIFIKNILDDQELHDLWEKICEKFEINENLERH